MLIHLFEKWSRSTWSEMLESARVPTELTDISKSKLSETLSDLRQQKDYDYFAKQNVTGSISQGWKDLNRPSPYFQESYESVISRFENDWTPADYLVHFAASCKNHKEYEPPYDLGRALRNLPSFIREDSLFDACEAAGIQVSRPDLTSNVHDHADLYVHVKGISYTVWSYVNTPKARQSVVKKLFSRGNDLVGVHLLAPISLDDDVTTVFGWKIVNQDYSPRLLEAIEEADILDSERTLTLARFGLKEDHNFVFLDGRLVNSIRRQNRS